MSVETVHGTTHFRLIAKHAKRLLQNYMPQYLNTE